MINKLGLIRISKVRHRIFCHLIHQVVILLPEITPEIAKYPTSFSALCTPKFWVLNTHWHPQSSFFVTSGTLSFKYLTQALKIGLKSAYSYSCPQLFSLICAVRTKSSFIQTAFIIQTKVHLGNQTFYQFFLEKTGLSHDIFSNSQLGLSGYLRLNLKKS